MLLEPSQLLEPVAMLKRLKRRRVSINILVVQMSPAISKSDNQKYKNLKPLHLQEENHQNLEFKGYADKSIPGSSQ